MAVMEKDIMRMSAGVMKADPVWAGPGRVSPSITAAIRTIEEFFSGLACPRILEHAFKNAFKMKSKTSPVSLQVSKSSYQKEVCAKRDQKDAASCQDSSVAFLREYASSPIQAA